MRTVPPSERTDQLITDILSRLRELSYELCRQDQIIEDLRDQVRRTHEGRNAVPEVVEAAA
ncbi:MAG: hypothetical protein ACRDJU_05150 [Actinomycetota bacterium]